MKNVSFTFIHRSDRKKTLCLAVYQGHRQSRIILPIKCQKTSWNKRHQRVNPSEIGFLHYNKLLDHYEDLTKKYITECYINNSVFSLEKLKSLILGKDLSENFCDFMQNEVDNSAIKPLTKKTHDSYVRRFRMYSPNATLAEANTVDFVNGFIKYEKERGNNENTVQKGLSVLRTYLHKALDKELVTKVVSIKVKNIEGNREFLTEDEIRSLIELYKKATLSDRLQKVLQYFLFGCFSGLRYGDISTLKYSNIKGNFLNFIMEKTNRNHAIPVMDDFAMSLIPAKENKPDNNLVFEMVSNQKYNVALKEIMTIAEIDKNITTHSARHTFATLSLSAGVPIEVVSKLLGHKDIKTTLIYAKVLPQLKIQGMEKLSALINAT